jgi:hypothetical protein
MLFLSSRDSMPGKIIFPGSESYTFLASNDNNNTVQNRIIDKLGADCK